MGRNFVGLVVISNLFYVAAVGARKLNRTEIGLRRTDVNATRRLSRLLGVHPSLPIRASRGHRLEHHAVEPPTAGGCE